jgi:hypothetical protein
MARAPGRILDVGAETDFGTGQPPGCKGKVDLLFLIARNGNMKYVQEQLLASFPGFVQTIEERLEGFDVQIMTANPDGEWPGFACETSPYGCPMHWPHCGADDENWICNESVDEWQPCDSELGAGNTFNAGRDATNKRCELFGGNRYIISGEPDMGDARVHRQGRNGGPVRGDRRRADRRGLAQAQRPDRLQRGLLAGRRVARRSDHRQHLRRAVAQLGLDAVRQGHRGQEGPERVVMLAVTAFPLEEGEPLNPSASTTTMQLR